MASPRRRPFGALLAWLVSWRLPFACAGGLGLALAAVLWLRMPRLPDPAFAGDAREHEPGSRTYVPALALVFAITIALGFIFRGFTTYLPSWMAQRADVLPAAQVVRGGLIASLVYAVGFLGRGSAATRAAAPGPSGSTSVSRPPPGCWPRASSPGAGRWC